MEAINPTCVVISSIDSCLPPQSLLEAISPPRIAWEDRAHDAVDAGGIETIVAIAGRYSSDLGILEACIACIATLASLPRITGRIASIETTRLLLGAIQQYWSSASSKALDTNLCVAIRTLQAIAKHNLELVATQDVIPMMSSMVKRACPASETRGVTPVPETVAQAIELMYMVGRSTVGLNTLTKVGTDHVAVVIHAVGSRIGDAGASSTRREAPSSGAGDYSDRAAGLDWAGLEAARAALQQS